MSNSADFIHLLSRDYRPAEVTQIKVSDKFNLEKKKSTVQFEDDVKETKTENKHTRILHDLTAEEEPSFFNFSKTREEQEEEASRLVLQLVSKTRAFAKHLREEEVSNVVSDTELRSYIRLPTEEKDMSEFSSLFHKVALGDWESKIEWGGYKEPAGDENKEEVIMTESPNSAEALLQKRRNPFLENMDFDNLISWTGDKEDVEAKAKAMPLILELGVAGQSIAKHVLPAHRPTPCVKSVEYQSRIQASQTGEIKSTAELSKGTLHADKEQKERFIEQRQKKRRQMAKDKTNRVTEAMGTLNVLAGGRGRTITSSLMGPGGTERTGRPSRRIGNASHDTEYVEQLDMVNNHSLFRDLSKVSLRQFHRPRLPWTIVRTSLLWQFGIRLNTGNEKGAPGGAVEANSSSYQAMMMGTHPGAVSKAKLRSESDLTPTEGKLVLLEYCEERPIIQMTKGMASKIVTYYRGDKSRCPVSAGGGDRPTRKREDSSKEDSSLAAGKSEKPHRLKGPNDAIGSTITDWVGKPPKKNKEDKKSEQSSINILPEGVTEILHPKVHGPFVGEIEEGQQVTGLVSNLFVAPIFRHEPEHTDFLMILGRNSGASTNGRLETLSVVLRELPTSVYTVGQVEPRVQVWAPNTQGEKNFLNPLISYLIAKVLTRAENREGHGLRLDEIQDRVLPNLGLQTNAMRPRLKHVATYDKNTQIYTTKPIGTDDYPGVDALGKSISVEGIAAFEVANASVTRLKDLGIYQLFAGAHACSSVGVAMVYLAGQMNAVRELARKVKTVLKQVPNMKGLTRQYYDESIAYLEALSKALRRRFEVAKFIHEELQLAPWHLSGEFHDVHKKGEGTGMMKLTGLGDPSGIGEGFSFLREIDSKPSKSMGKVAANQKDKITGTEDDLRKLTMKQMAAILRSYRMTQAYIDTLKRWDRVHVIREISTKTASDGMGGGLERFARGEKMKLSEQKQMYRDRIQVIWKRQIAALSDPGDRAIAGDGGPADVDDAATKASEKKADDDDEDSDLEDDDDFAAEMEEELMDSADATKLVAAQGGDDGRRASQLEDQDLTDAKNLVNLKKEKAEARAAREGLTMDEETRTAEQTSGFKRKVVRRRITKTYPDGRVETTFKFIVHAEEVGKIMARLAHEKKEKKDITERPEYPPDDRQIGHALFEDEDDFEFSSRGRGSAKGRGKRRGRGATTARGVRMKAQFGAGKIRTGTAKALKKRKRDEDDIEEYNSVARRKGTSNRKERGSIRDRRPHVIFANRLEDIRAMAEARPQSGPFHRAVDARAWPRYYEVISDPIDLSAIRDKIKNYEYRSTEQFLKDFQLMRANAIKFNGAGTPVAEESVQIFEFVKSQIEESRGELADLEEAVQEQLSTKPKKKTKSRAASKANSMGESGTGSGDTWADIDFDNLLSDDSD